MATKYAPQATFNWSDSWCDSDDGVQDVVKPGAGDLATLTVNSGDCAVNENTAALGGLNMTGYTGTITVTNDIDVVGSANLAGTWSGAGATSVDGTVNHNANMSGYTGLLTFDGNADAHTIISTTAFGNLAVNNNGSSVVLDNAIECASFTLTAGTFDCSASTYGVTVNGNLTYTAGTLSNSGTWTLATSANITWAAATNQLAELVVNEGVTATLTGNLYAKKLSGAGTIAPSTTQKIFIKTATTPGWWAITGTVSCNTDIEDTAVGAGATITLANKDLRIYDDASSVLTMTGGISLGTGSLEIFSTTTAGAETTVDMAGYKISCANITIGHGSLDRRGELKLGEGIHRITGNIAAGAGSTTNKLGLESCYLILGGTLTATKITITANAGAPHIIGGTITDDDGSAVYHCHETTDGGGGANANETFDKHAYPGSLVTCGVGV
uniref:Uncharacterized protein n=1 Tax=viral metagenome TaxID=1070528 RepID=A0A6M3L7A9_9ZZZZ